jgi:hypothetical protein
MEKDQTLTQQSKIAILPKNKKSNKYQIYKERNGPTKPLPCNTAWKDH